MSTVFTPETPLPDGLSPAALLRWYMDAGVDECIGETPLNRYELSAAALVAAGTAPQARGPSRAAPASSPPPLAAAPGSLDIAAKAQSLAELQAAVESFQDCSLKATARSTIFAAGTVPARLMIVGESPDEQDDAQGEAFIGPGGRLLDRMLASIGLDRNSGVYMTTLLPWRPPGNRRPEPRDLQMMLPFLLRHIELAAPSCLLLLGGAAASTVLERGEEVHRMRGQWHDLTLPRMPGKVPAMVTFSPAALLATPEKKALAWRDMLEIRRKIHEQS